MNDLITQPFTAELNCYTSRWCKCAMFTAIVLSTFWQLTPSYTNSNNYEVPVSIRLKSQEQLQKKAQCCSSHHRDHWFVGVQCENHEMTSQRITEDLWFSNIEAWAAIYDINTNCTCFELSSIDTTINPSNLTAVLPIHFPVGDSLTSILNLTWVYSTKQAFPLAIQYMIHSSGKNGLMNICVSCSKRIK